MPNRLLLLIHCFNFSFKNKPQAISVIYTPKFSVNPVAVNKFSSSLKTFIVKGNKIQLGFDNKYAENNQRVRKSI